MEQERLSSEPSEPARRQRGHLFRHQLLFLVGILLGLAGGVALTESRVAGVVLFVLAGVAWVGSGVSAVAGKRHMFGRSTGWGGNVKMRPSERSGVGSAVVGGLIALLGLGLVNVGVQLALHRGPATAYDPCDHVVCPAELSWREAGDAEITKRVPTCTTLYAGATCANSLTATDPARRTTAVTPANTMHCDLPPGAIDCPALWIEKAPMRSIYVAGCCGYDTLGAFCGVPSIEEMARTCDRITPGERWSAAP